MTKIVFLEIYFSDIVQKQNSSSDKKLLKERNASSMIHHYSHCDHRLKDSGVVGG